MACRCEDDRHISGSWQFGLNGQMSLHFDSENGHWRVDHPGGRWMKEKWESDRAVTDFLKKVSMGDCRAWLQAFMVRWEEMLKTTDAHSLSDNVTIDPQPRDGQPRCEVQGEVDQKVFVSCDFGKGKSKYVSPLGEEVKCINAWETQTDTLRDTGDLLQGQMPDVTPEKHTDKDPHSLSNNVTIDPRPRDGQPRCEVQGEVDQKVFVSCDFGKGKSKYMSPLGEEVKCINAWETQTDTLRDTGDLRKGQMPDVTPEKHTDKASPTTGPTTVKSSATAIKHITWILPKLLTSFIITVLLGCPFQEQIQEIRPHESSVFSGYADTVDASSHGLYHF
ncbi:hypothetical protein MG293_010565 [Ovis ammon polii]|uniref:MHC class I antigen n=1 Tax=Ovis ammon polii TaxID=230172 RepID=A0AAD4Y950_OVIAM|nr:hypothetical protein MG293_010565 [Ovis ammon polii]